MKGQQNFGCTLFVPPSHLIAFDPPALYRTPPARKQCGMACTPHPRISKLELPSPTLLPPSSGRGPPLARALFRHPVCPHAGQEGAPHLHFWVCIGRDVRQFLHWLKALAQPKLLLYIVWATCSYLCRGHVLSAKTSSLSSLHQRGSVSAPGVRRASSFDHYPPMPVFAPTSPNNLEYLLAVSKNLAHPLHPVCDDGRGGGWKWWE